MSSQLTPLALMAKADRACSSARALLDLGDVDGACNRADYKGDSVELSDAQEMVAQAETFVNAMHAEFMPKTPNDDGH